MKYKKIIYWILLVFFSGMMTFSAVLSLTHAPALVQSFRSLGYPDYVMNILGTAKLIGVISLLQSRFTVLKEWAYAGFTIHLIGAIWSHLSVGQPIFVPSLLFIILWSSYILWKQISKNTSSKTTPEAGEFA